MPLATLAPSPSCSGNPPWPLVEILKKFNLTGAAEFVAWCSWSSCLPSACSSRSTLDKFQWFAVVMVYLVFAGAMPIQVLKTPRDYLTSIMMIVMIVCAVLGIAIVLSVNEGQATITAPVFTGFSCLPA